MRRVWGEGEGAGDGDSDGISTKTETQTKSKKDEGKYKSHSRGVSVERYALTLLFVVLVFKVDRRVSSKSLFPSFLMRRGDARRRTRSALQAHSQKIVLGD